MDGHERPDSGYRIRRIPRPGNAFCVDRRADKRRSPGRSTSAVARQPVFARPLKTGRDEDPARRLSYIPRNQNGGKYRAAGKFISTLRNWDRTGKSKRMVNSIIMEMPCRKGEMARKKRSPMTVTITPCRLRKKAAANAPLPSTASRCANMWRARPGGSDSNGKEYGSKRTGAEQKQAQKKAGSHNPGQKQPSAGNGKR